MRPLEQSTDQVRERLLNAALAVATDFGIARLGLGDVARRAGLSRQTLYRHFAGKSELIRATVARETDDVLRQGFDAAWGTDAPGPRLTAVLTATLRAARHHPLLQRLVRTEPEALLPWLIGEPSPVVACVRPWLTVLLAEVDQTAAPHLLRMRADLLTRALISYAIHPGEASDAELASLLSGLAMPAEG